MTQNASRSGAAARRGWGTRWVAAAGGLLAVAGLAAVGLAGYHGAEPRSGEALYSEHCASCHGPQGRGQNLARPGGSLAPEQEGWIAPALDMRGHCFAHSRAQLIALIRGGSAQKGSTMLPFKDRLSDEEIGTIVSYLETLWDASTRSQYEARGNLPARPVK